MSAENLRTSGTEYIQAKKRERSSPFSCEQGSIPLSFNR